MRILVVEDELDLCDAISEGLRMDGYAVDTCYDGHRAYELLTTEVYDLAVLDLNLPGMDGMAVLEAVRRENQGVKVLILSARGSVCDKVEGLNLGANDYLAKPFDFAELEARIRCLFRQKFCAHSNQLSFDRIYV
ncbi:MAG: response regulator, partial [Clostridia bacterium]